jgi:ATP-binding cassette, subfamily B, bacterial
VPDGRTSESGVDEKAAEPRDEPSVPVVRLMFRALGLVWRHERTHATALTVLTLAAALIPTVSAWVARGVVDTVQAAAAGELAVAVPLVWVAAEGGLMLAYMASQRVSSVLESIVYVRLGHRIQRSILQRSQELELRDFEDSEFYDRLSRAQREAGSRPLDAAGRVFMTLRALVSFAGAAVLLAGLTPWAVLLLFVAAFPSLIVEAKFSRVAFRLLNNRTPEARERAYLETLLTREDYVKETKLGGLAGFLLARYDALFARVYREDRDLAIRSGLWSFVVGALGTLTFFSLYGYIAWQAAAGEITIGDMTMFLLLVRQGQSSVGVGLGALSGSFADALYLSNLFGFLDHEPDRRAGTETQGTDPSAGIRFIDVSFRYPGSDHDVLQHIDLELPPGKSLAIVGANGSGKTTLVKLLTGLYLPTQGRIDIDGLDLRAWDPAALCRRTAVVLQSYARFQFTAGDNIGLGDVERHDDRRGWEEAARAGQAAEFIEALPAGYRTRVGTWFPGGIELSGGQWQKLALSRAFMRRGAKTIVLDEPTSSLDAEAEERIFDHVQSLARGESPPPENTVAGDAGGVARPRNSPVPGREKSILLISHRFSTVRHADEIVVLEHGRIVERGDHSSLLQAQGLYARLFLRQARAYR